MPSPAPASRKMPPIAALLPHEPPMRLVDALLEGTERAACCDAIIKPDHPFMQAGGVPAVLALELIAQTVAAHVGFVSYLKGQPPRLGFLIGCRELDLHTDAFVSGTRLRIEVEQSWADAGDAAVYRGRVSDEERLVAEGTVTVYQGALRGE